jgi:flagella basal body P-ring formation protein FlgA
MTDGFSEVITGEEAFRYTVNFLPQGNLAVRTVVKGSTAQATAVWSKGALSPTLTASLATKTYNLDAKVDGRWYSNGVTWSSSDVTKVTVSRTGIITVLASTGSVTITATYPNGGTAGSCALTLSA